MGRLIYLTSVLVFALHTGHALGESRTWRDSTGKFSVEAEFVDAKDGKVRLRKTDGTVISIAPAQLSKEDQAYVTAAIDRAGKPQSDEKWRRDYVALVEGIKVARVDGKTAIDFGDAKELEAWYEIAAQAGRLKSKMLEPQNKTPANMNALKILEKKAHEAHKQLEGIEWTAQVVNIPTHPDAIIRLGVPEMPHPLRVIFMRSGKDVKNWAKVQAGDTIRFTPRFEVDAAIEFPIIEARMTLRP